MILREFLRFDVGTKYKIDQLCGLAMGNPQWPGVLDWFSKSNILIQSLLWIS
jgi:hypothetical protein